MSPPQEPTPAYPAKDTSVLYGDKVLYARIAATAAQPGARELIEEFEIPIRSGKAWVVPQGHVVRLSTPYGPQVGDLNIWARHNPRERFWAARTRQLHATHVSVGDRLWSVLPWLRPLATIVGDCLRGYGVDAQGGRVHDLLGTRCDPYVNKLLTGDEADHHCHSNLVRAVLPYGLTELDVHDVLNVFQVTGLTSAGKYFMSPSPATPATFLELFAETDLLCAMSTCPGGDLSVYGWGAESAAAMRATCRPLGVAVYRITDDGVLAGWRESQPVSYTGMHGMQMPAARD